MQSASEASGFRKLNQGLISSQGCIPRSKYLTSDSGATNTYRNGPNSYVGKLRSKSDFHFKYVSEPELNAVVKRVRRANQKKRDEEKWKYFLKLQEEKHSGDTAETFCEMCISSRELESTSCCADCGLPESASVTAKTYQEESQREEEEGGTSEKLFYSETKEFNSVDDTSHTYQLGPGLSKRLRDLLATVGKMSALLASPSLHNQFEDEDVDRTIKRSLEFDAMFARNHLYEIQRLLKDSKQLSTIKTSNSADLESKISATLKCITQALQVYTRHVSKGSRVKYQQVVPIFQSISSTQSLLEQLTGQRLFPMRQELEVACSYVKQVLLELSATETKTVSTASHRPATVRVKERHKPSADLSMYSRRRGGADWRRSAARLARVRLPPPMNKKHLRKAESVRETEALDEKLKIDHPENQSSGQDCNSKIYDKLQEPRKETSAKETPFRNATRAVPEENVTTMMEMIPHEPLKDSEICLDEDSFQALKLLSRARVPVKTLIVANSDDDVADNQNSPTRSKPENEEGSRSTTIKSSREPSNVQLICVTEGAPRSCPPTTQAEEVDSAESFTTLTIDDQERQEALEFRQKVVEYQKSSPHYKDGKALGIEKRLANRILTEMLLDFQRDEMDQVVRMLYNLEFE